MTKFTELKIHFNNAIEKHPFILGIPIWFITILGFIMLILTMIYVIFAHDDKFNSLCILIMLGGIFLWATIAILYEKIRKKSSS